MKFYVFDVASTSLTASLTNYTDYLRINAGKWFLVKQIIGSSTGIYSLNIHDSYQNDYWFCFPKSFSKVKNANVIGGVDASNRYYPFILDTPRILAPSSTITFILDETSGSNNAVQIILIGQEMDTVSFNKNFLGYCVDVSLGASQTIEDNITTKQGRDFWLRKITGNATSTSAKVNFKVGEKAMGNTRSNWLNMVGIGQKPHYLSEPQKVPQNSNFYYEVEDTSAVANVTQLCFWGEEIVKER